MPQLRFTRDGKAYHFNFKYIQGQDENGLVTKLIEIPSGYVLTLSTGEKETANDRVLGFMMNPAGIKKSILSDRYGYDPIRRSYDSYPARVEPFFVVLMTALVTFGLLCLAALF
jgi:hypothetical protein